MAIYSLWLDDYTINLEEMHKELMKSDNSEHRQVFNTLLDNKNVVVKEFNTIDNEIVYSGNNLTIINFRELYLYLLNNFKSWYCKLYTLTLPEYRDIGVHSCDLITTLEYFISRKQSQIQRIYEDLLITFSPIENTSAFESTTTTYSGTETNEKTKSGSKSNTKVESGTETNTNVKSGNLTDNLSYVGAETDTNNHDVSADNSTSLLTDFSDTDTKTFTNRSDNRTETYNNVTDTNTRAFNQRSTTDTEAFTNYTDTDTKTFTNRSDVSDTTRHGNIGVTTNVYMLNEDIRFRISNDLLETICKLFVREFMYL